MARAAESPLGHQWRAFLAGGTLSLTRLLTGFVRVKYVALVLGTAGVGFLSQATQLQLLGISLGSLSIAVGIINRMGAIGANQRERESRLLSTAFTMQFTVSLVMLGAALIWSRALTDAVFGSEALAASPMSPRDVLVVICSVPLAVLASGYLEAVFFGAGRYDLYVRASIWATVLGFFATVTIIAVWRLPGAFWSIFASSALLVTPFLIYVRRVRPFSHLFRFGFDRSEANALFRFSVVVLISGALVPFARLWVQRAVIGNFGVDANGILQVPFAVTAYYTPFLTNALWGRMHPTVTRVGATREGRRELTAAVRLTVTMAAAAIVTILFLKDLLVPLAYSRAFAPAAHLLPAQLLGDYFYFVALPFTIYALGLSRLRVYLAANLGYSIVAAATSFLLLRSIGLVGVPIGYGLSAACGALVAMAWLIWHRDEDMPLTVGFIAGGFAVVAVQSALAWRGSHPVLQGIICVTVDAAALLWLWKARGSGDEHEPSAGGNSSEGAPVAERAPHEALVPPGHEGLRRPG